MSNVKVAELLTRRPPPTAAVRVKEAAPLFLYLAVLLFLVSLAVYGGMWFFNRNLKASQDEVLKQISLKEDELRSEVVEQIFLLEVKLRSMRELLSRHSAPSKVFTMLEQSTLPQVRLTNLSIDPNVRRVDVTGEAASFSVLSKQIAELEKNPLISQIEFGGLSRSEGRLVEFRLTLTVTPQAIFTR